MPKLAIYIPKKDMRVIERWRKQINFSKVFMKALFQEIRERSRVVETDEDRLKAAAQHYKRTLAESSDHLIEFGHQLGSRHVVECRLRPDVIQQLLLLNESDNWEPTDVDTIQAAVGDDLRLIDDLLRQHAYDEPSWPTWRNVVFRGYVQGVTAAWRQVCDHM